MTLRFVELSERSAGSSDSLSITKINILGGESDRIDLTRTDTNCWVNSRRVYCRCLNIWNP
ncbi:hypothetical protein [Anabaena sp. UHCC 0253]|uniref:hypothetical protein n=1 Tax=Anabaena sp. UHCC 0253 TaxID=2590019 RepID=UPI001444E31A|nr:hypothetical protein [Anabaena sp. UHCC 0253]